MQLLPVGPGGADVEEIPRNLLRPGRVYTVHMAGGKMAQAAPAITEIDVRQFTERGLDSQFSS